MNTRSLIHKLHEVLNLLKGFTAGYKSSNAEEMLMGYEGKVFKITITPIGEGEVEDYIDKSI